MPGNYDAGYFFMLILLFSVKYFTINMIFTLFSQNYVFFTLKRGVKILSFTEQNRYSGGVHGNDIGTVETEACAA
jgi:hypothetical protein